MIDSVAIQLRDHMLSMIDSVAIQLRDHMLMAGSFYL
jgi:hypothetical protein